MEKFRKNSLVFKFRCSDCGLDYTGETFKSLDIRSYEHWTSKKSSMFKHCNEYSHTFDHEKVVILDTETNDYKRKLSELSYIALYV